MAPSSTRGAATVAPGFESDLIERRVLYKHSTPYHPQTCGKVERWHRTLKKFLAKHPAANAVEMQAVLYEVVRYYNEVRPHRARNRQTPLHAYEGRDKMPAGTLIDQPHHRIRFDVVDVRGHVTLRYLGKLRHLNVGWPYRGQPIRLYVVDEHVTIVTEDGVLVGEIVPQSRQGLPPD